MEKNPENKSNPFKLRRLATWRSAFIVSLGGSLLVAVSLGPIAAALGPASIFVWVVTVIVAILQCYIITELALMFPQKSGGTPTYTHEAFKKTPWVGALSNWGYWLGWIPVIPVNLVLASGYLKAAFFPQIDVLVLTFILIFILYILNYFGLQMGVRSSFVMALCAMAPLAVIAISPVFKPALFHKEYLFPFIPLGGSWSSLTSWLLIIKWMFVAVWASYAFEAASTVVAEMKNPEKEVPKAMTAASLVGFFAYGIVPLMLLAIAGPDALAKDPTVAFLPAAAAIFGQQGAAIVSIMLIAALLLGAQTAIIGSSRTLYEMSRDGLTIKQFGSVNKHGIPIGSAVWDMTIAVLLLLIFKTEVVSLVAASNIGYLIPFMLVLPAYILLRLRHPDSSHPYKLPAFFIPIAMFLTLFNWILFWVGGVQWGQTVMLTGAVIMLTFIPFYCIRRLIQDK